MELLVFLVVVGMSRVVKRKWGGVESQAWGTDAHTKLVSFLPSWSSKLWLTQKVPTSRQVSVPGRGASWWLRLLQQQPAHPPGSALKERDWPGKVAPFVLLQLCLSLAKGGWGWGKIVLLCLHLPWLGGH